MQPLSRKDAKEGQVIVPRGNGEVKKGPVTHRWPRIKPRGEPRRPLARRPSPRGDGTPGGFFTRSRTLALGERALGRAVALTTEGAPPRPAAWVRRELSRPPRGQSENSPGRRAADPEGARRGDAHPPDVRALLWQLEGGFQFSDSQQLDERCLRPR